MDRCLSVESGHEQAVLAGSLNSERRHGDTVKVEEITRSRWLVA